MLEEKEGAFVSSLKRGNKEIRTDRAEAISETAEIGYKREVEDSRMRIKALKREQENMLDMSSKTTYDLTPGKDFNSRKFIDDDIAFGIAIRNEEIKLEIAEARYAYLFGGKA